MFVVDDAHKTGFTCINYYKTTSFC